MDVFRSANLGTVAMILTREAISNLERPRDKAPLRSARQRLQQVRVHTCQLQKAYHSPIQSGRAADTARGAAAPTAILFKPAQELHVPRHR